MENASKALYIAASVLVGMMIMGIMVYLFRVGGRVGEQYDEKQNKEQIELFNSRFENHDRDNNTIIDIISVTNLANSINENYDFDVARAVSIDIKLGAKTLCISSKNSIKRNYLFVGDAEHVANNSNKVYVYDLLDTKIDSLECIVNEDGDRQPLAIPSSSYDSGDTLSTVKNENDKMIYKYTFKCTDIQYNKIAGRVNYMKFEMTKNY